MHGVKKLLIEGHEPMDFENIPKIEYTPLEQTPQPPINKGVVPEDSPITSEISRAENIINEYDKTIQLIDWLIGLSDQRVKDIVVQINPEENPEVWTAMRRVFGETANQALSGRSYLDVLDALDKITIMETEEINNEALQPELEFIEAYNNQDQQIEEAEEAQMMVLDQDLQAVEEAAMEQEFGPEPPKPRQPFLARLLRVGRFLVFRR